MANVTPGPGPDAGARRESPGSLRASLAHELEAQRRTARDRARGRAAERRETEARLDRSAGLVDVNDPARVAQRLDRVTRYLTGGDPQETPADAPIPDLVAGALERARRTRTGRPARGTGGHPLEGVETPSSSAPETLLERVVNSADFLSVRYLDAGVRAQRSVGRISIRDGRRLLRGYGTGFLVSPSLLLTNHHVLPDAGTAATSVVELNYQEDVDGKPLLPDVHGLDPDRFFVADRALDFALVAVAAPPDVLGRYGFCPLTAAQGTVLVGEAVTIVQHPGGGRKQIALRENTVLDIPELVVHYSADTEPGSSGSPVFNDQWEVVALHHASVPTPERAPAFAYLNEGIRISRILAHLGAATMPPAWRVLLDELTDADRRLTVRHSDPAAPDPPDVAPDPPDEATSLLRVAEHGARAPVSTRDVSRPVGRSADDTTVTLEVPLRITLQLGEPAARGPAAAPPAVDAHDAVDARDARDARDAHAEAISIDPDYSNRGGYDPGFLALTLPLPGYEALGGLASAELRYHHFSVVMHRCRRLALFAAVNIDGTALTRPRRESDRWILDPRLPGEEQTGESVYRDNDLDRGHLVRRLDPAWGEHAKAANDDTFHFTNACPQHHRFNAGRSLWLGLEDYVLKNTDNRDLAVSVITGPVLADDDPQYRGVALPRQFFKIIAMVTTAGRLSVTGYLLSQEALLDEFSTGPEEFAFGAYRTFQVPVSRIAGATGLDLDAYVAADALAHLEGTPRPRAITRLEDILLGA